MKKNIKLKLNAVILVCIAIITFGCDLKPQEKFEFDPATTPQVTFGAMTPWEWIQSNPKNEFNFLIEAIKLTNLQEEYSNTTDKRTYFLLKDFGWTNFNGIKRREFGNPNVSLADVDPIKLRKILLYYIVPTYVDQGPGHLLTLDANYTFETLSTDPLNQIMTLSRDWNYTIGINNSPVLPTTKFSANVKLHNYIFSNGNSVAHLLENHVRLAPFE